MPAKKTSRTAGASGEATTNRTHEAIRRRHIRGNENGKSNSHGLFERAKGRISSTDFPEMLNVFQKRATGIFHSGESEARKITSQLTLMGQMVKERWDEHHDLPWRTVTAFTVAIMYFVGPFDVIPNKIPVLGLLDDVAVLAFCFKLIQHDLRNYAEAEGIDLMAYGL
jgi:uncharacterized membrane protein YkvA (DUF1232 family)